MAGQLKNHSASCVLYPHAKAGANRRPGRGRQAPEPRGVNSSHPISACARRPTALALSLLVAILVALGASSAQEQRRFKVPVLGKISGGSAQLAFSGKVQSVDMRRMLLHVSTVEGDITEIFHIKKDVPVSAADGTKLKITELTPGLNVIVYFEKKGDRRKVKDVFVLGAAPAEEKQEQNSSSPS